MKQQMKQYQKDEAKLHEDFQMPPITDAKVSSRRGKLQRTQTQMIDEILAHKDVLMKVNDGVAQFYKAKSKEHGYSDFEEAPSIENLLKMRREEAPTSGVGIVTSPLNGTSETNSERVESKVKREREEATPDEVLQEQAKRQGV